MFITSIMIFVWWASINNPADMIIWRVGVLVFIVLANFIYHFYPCRAMIMVRTVPLLLCLIQWYPETYEFCKHFAYQDHVFASIDYNLFGCQPSLEMSTWITSTFWHEAFSCGYYSYYYMMIAVIAFYFFFRYEDLERAAFVFLLSFFFFYFIFEFLPVAGPQYYYCALGVDAAQTAEFPEMGNYFVEHTEVLPIDVRGIFSQWVLDAQEIGERPTAAFPSSHVGIATVLMILAIQARNKILFFALLPLYLLLCVATVYLKAHYVIDSISGFAVGIGFFYLTQWIYPKAKVALRLKD